MLLYLFFIYFPRSFSCPGAAQCDTSRYSWQEISQLNIVTSQHSESLIHQHLKTYDEYTEEKATKRHVRSAARVRTQCSVPEDRQNCPQPPRLRLPSLKNRSVKGNPKVKRMQKLSGSQS